MRGIQRISLYCITILIQQTPENSLEWDVNVNIIDNKAMRKKIKSRGFATPR